VEVAINPESERFEKTDGRWRDQVVALVKDLREEGIDARTVDRPDPDALDKGPAAEIILALGTSGAVSAAVTMFQAWLARDKTRFIEIVRRREDGSETSVTLRADNFDAKVFKEFAREERRDLGDAR